MRAQDVAAAHRQGVQAGEHERDLPQQLHVAGVVDGRIGGAALGETARLHRIGLLHQGQEVADARDALIGRPPGRVLERIDDTEEQVGDADLFARRRWQLRNCEREGPTRFL